MCDTCGCNITPGNKHLIEIKGKMSRTSDGKAAVDVLQGLLSENDHQAQHNRQHFDKHQVLAINLMSSPGSGKTALLEATIEAIGKQLNIAVIEGDLETENDAQRIRAKGVPAIQIATGSACHLDAHMVHSAVHQLDLKSLDILFIENVGNLVCPASFDLGHHRNVTLLSVTEGDDKPAKYPVMFRAADAMLITKVDLLQVLDDFNCDNAHQNLRNLANPAPVLEISAKTRQGFEGWINWLQQELHHYRQNLARGEHLHPRIQPDGHKLRDAGHAHYQHIHS